MIAQKPETQEVLARLLARPRRVIDQSPEAQLERLRAWYERLADVGGFPPPAQDADWASLKDYRAQYTEQLDEADILDEIEGILGHRA